MDSDCFVRPDWPAPSRVRAWMTTRRGGVSKGPYASCNLAGHVGDDPQAVAQNRAWVQQRLGLPQEPCWLEQVHGNLVLPASAWRSGVQADGLVSHSPGQVLAILTADCLPVLLCHKEGHAIAALHAGWRGLAAGIIERGIAALGCAPDELMAWVGPGIGPRHYRVGEEVAKQLSQALPSFREALQPCGEGSYLADLAQMAHLALQACGVGLVVMSGRCTMQDASRWFSHRRDGVTGRMAALIWIAATP